MVVLFLFKTLLSGKTIKCNNYKGKFFDYTLCRKFFFCRTTAPYIFNSHRFHLQQIKNIVTQKPM